MLLSIEHDFVFLCTPKCASTAIHVALTPYSDISLPDPPRLKHTTFHDYDKYFKPYLKARLGRDDFETVCLIRNPLSWLYSWYRFGSRLKSRKAKGFTAQLTFPEFIEGYMQPQQPDYAKVGSQFTFVKNEVGEVGVDKIFAYDNLDQFLDYMGQKIGQPVTIDRLNISPSKRHESSAAEFADFIRRKISRVFNVSPPAVVHEENYGLSDSLLSELEDFLADDFRVYNQAKANARVPIGAI